MQNLLVRKKSGEELDYEPRLNPINDFLEERLAYYEQSAVSMKGPNHQLDSQLDLLFRSTLQEAWS